MRDGDIARVQQPKAVGSLGSRGVDTETVHVQSMSGSFYTPAVTACNAAFGPNFTLSGGQTIGLVNIAPKHHRAAVTSGCGARIDLGTRLHAHLARLLQGATALPPTANQN